MINEIVTTALGAKQESLTIAHFLNKLIVSCKEAVRFPFYFLGGIFKLDNVITIIIVPKE